MNDLDVDMFAPAALQKDDPAPELVGISDHYTEAGLDYRFWSTNYNMHFGYWRIGLGLFNREAMLDEMNRQIYIRLGITTQTTPKVVDFGCGVGASIRWIARAKPSMTILGCTIVPWQVAKGQQLNRDAKLHGQAQIKQLDYRRTGLPAESVDAVYCIESICHDLGLAKQGAIEEAVRILMPGGRFIVADGFLRTGKLPSWLRGIFNRVCHNWAVETFAGLPEFRDCLECNGLRVIEEKEISLRVGPSALQTPLVTARWLFATRHDQVSTTRWRHVYASLLAPVIGICLPWFCYKIIVAEKVGLNRWGRTDKMG